MYQIFDDQLELSNHMSLELPEVHLHHLINVIRIKENEWIYLVSKGEQFKGRISYVSKKPKKCCVDQLIHVQTHQNRSKISCVIPYIMKDKFELILQKVTELGVDTIYVLPMDHGVIKFSSEKIKQKVERWHTIVYEAVNQSKQLYRPYLFVCDHLKLLPLDAYDCICVAHEQESQGQPLYMYEEDLQKAQNILYVIGPEGGLSEKESNYFMSQEHTYFVSLGKTILRAETAAITGVSILNYIQQKK